MDGIRVLAVAFPRGSPRPEPGLPEAVRPGNRPWFKCDFLQHA